MLRIKLRRAILLAKNGAGYGNRTRVYSLGSYRTTTVLTPRYELNYSTVFLEIRQLSNPYLTSIPVEHLREQRH